MFFLLYDTNLIFYLSGILQRISWIEPLLNYLFGRKSCDHFFFARTEVGL